MALDQLPLLKQPEKCVKHTTGAVWKETAFKTCIFSILKNNCKSILILQS